MGKKNLNLNSGRQPSNSNTVDIKNYSLSLENSNGEYFGQNVGLGSNSQNANGSFSRGQNGNYSQNSNSNFQNQNNGFSQNSNENSQSQSQKEKPAKKIKTKKSKNKEKQSKPKKPKKKISFFGWVGRIVGGLIGSVLTFVLTFSLVLYFKYNINIVETGLDLKTIYETVDTNSKFTNQFSEADYSSYEDKTKNFDVNFDAVLFSDKEIASFINYSVEQTKLKSEENNKTRTLSSSEKVDASEISASPKTFDLVSELDLKLVQLKLYNTYNSQAPTHLTDMNFVISLSSSKVKSKYLNGKFYSKVGDLLPEKLYISCDVEILKNDDETSKFDYKVQYKSIAINNLNAEKSAKFLDSINNFLKIGTAKEFSENLGQTFANAMIGNSETTGLVSALEPYGAKGYSFYTNGETGYLVIFSHKTTETATITYSNLKTATNQNPTSFTVLDNDIVLEDLTANGYKFLGFYNSAVGGEKITSFSAWKLKDLTLYARWEIINYNISYVMRGGKTEVKNPTTYTIEDEFVLCDATKTKETPFLGWTGTLTDVSTKKLKIQKGTFGDLVFYAWFDDDERSLSLYGDGKKLAELVTIIGMPVEKSEVEKVFDLNKLGLAGYTYGEWFVSNDFTKKYDFEALVSDDLNLYTNLNYIVDKILFYPYLSKFKSSLLSKNLTVNSSEELTAFIQFVLFYDVQEKVSVNLGFVSNPRQVDEEFALARKNAVASSKTFQTGSTVSWTSYTVGANSYIEYFVSNSTLSTDATLTFDENGGKEKKTYNFAFALDSASKRSEDFDGFKINNVAKTLTVKTSTQLVYAIEQGFKPECEPGSSAEKMYEKAKAVLKKICTDEMTDIQKLRAIYEWIIINVNYDNIAFQKSYEISAIQTRQYNSWYIEGVFDSGLAVCEGYAKAFLLMAKIEGIPTIFVTGNRHAWNKVYLNGNWYGIDATHGDSGVSGKEALSYEQFLFTDLFKTSLGYSSSDYSEFKAETEYSYFSNQKYSIDGKDFDLFANSIDEVALIASFAKKLATEKGYSSYTFDFEASSSLKTSTIANIVGIKIGKLTVKYSYEQKNALVDHYTFIIE